jgi:hypothetical protein
MDGDKPFARGSFKGSRDDRELSPIIQFRYFTVAFKPVGHLVVKRDNKKKMNI